MQEECLKKLQLTATKPMLRSCDGLRLHYAEKDAIIFFCAPLLRQLPLRSLLCLSLCESCRLGSILEKMTLFFLNASVVPSASSVRCVRMQWLRSWARLHVRLSRFACMLRLLSPAIVRKTRGRDCGQRLSRKGARPLSSALPHGSPDDRSDNPRRTTDAQRENIDMHGRLHGVRLISTYLLSMHWRTVVRPEFDICMPCVSRSSLA